MVACETTMMLPIITPTLCSSPLWNSPPIGNVQPSVVSCNKYKYKYLVFEIQLQIQIYSKYVFVEEPFYQKCPTNGPIAPPSEVQYSKYEYIYKYKYLVFEIQILSILNTNTDTIVSASIKKVSTTHIFFCALWVVVQLQKKQKECCSAGNSGWQSRNTKAVILHTLPDGVSTGYIITIQIQI